MLEKIINAYKGYFNYLWQEITFQSSPWWHNYFGWLLLISLFFWALEWVRPWRAEQPKFRKDFWLDWFYMFFNFFLFSLVIYNAFSTVIVDGVNALVLGATGFDLTQSNPMQHLPYWAILLIGFVVRDFVQWNVHRLLHRSAWLWEYHKLHHSVEQMGFAAHLRYHWAETLVYRTFEYLPLALLGIGLHDFFIIHIFATAVGHANHANFYLVDWQKGIVFGALIGLFVGTLVLNLDTMGILASVGAGVAVGIVVKPIWKYVFNSPEMHIWHHAYDLPTDKPTGVNFGITLALWDYIFQTNYIPYDGRDIKLGFPDMENYPHTFVEQVTHLK